MFRFWVSPLKEILEYKMMALKMNSLSSYLFCCCWFLFLTYTKSFTFHKKSESSVYLFSLNTWSKGRIKICQRYLFLIYNRDSHWSIKDLMHYTTDSFFIWISLLKSNITVCSWAFTTFLIYQTCHKHHNIVTSKILSPYRTIHASAQCADCTVYGLYCWDSTYVAKFSMALQY